VPHGASAERIREAPEGEVAAQSGAALHARAAGSLGYRNGCRERDVEARVGALSLAIPKLRAGT